MNFSLFNRRDSEPTADAPKNETSPDSVRLIVGLGNPGSEYQNTRHNVGFLVLDRLAEMAGIQIGKKAFKGLTGEGRLENRKAALLKPQTYMNLSGQSVREAMRFYRMAPEDILVICDDVNLPVGRLRLRPEGSHGGQNGLKSVIAEIGTDAFPRLRVGVGRPEGEKGLIGHVLGKWGPDELPVVREQTERATDAIRFILSEGIDAAMNRFNAKS
jgi:PTH1 family peptidyl-tRNA hydrolase